MKYILLAILTTAIPSLIYAQEEVANTPAVTVKLSFWQILLSVLAPAILLIIGYLLIKKFKL